MRVELSPSWKISTEARVVGSSADPVRIGRDSIERACVMLGRGVETTTLGAAKGSA